MTRRSTLLLLVLAIATLTVPGTATGQLTERLYGDACNDGDTSACVIFGLMSELGQRVDQDYGRARGLYRRACEEGGLVGCTNLGLMYEEGRGGPADADEARGRYEIACEGDEQLACDLLAAMDRMVSDGDGDEPRYAKVGWVADARTSALLADALVEVPELGIQVVADADGHLVLGRLPEGTYVLTAKRLGYYDLQGELQVPGQTEFLVQMDQLDVVDDRPGRLVGQITDDGSSSISNVDVQLLGQGLRALSNGGGRFVLSDVDPGLLHVRFTRLGYAPRTATLVIQPGQTAEVDVVTPTEAIELEPISVTVQSQFLERNGFYERERRAPFGRFLDRRDIEDTHLTELYEIVSRTPHVWLDDPLKKGVGTPAHPFTMRVFDFAPGGDGSFTPCFLAVYLDGVLPGPGTLGPEAKPFDLQMIDLAMVDAVEIYTGSQTPVQFRANPCGSIVIWTGH